MNDQVKQAQNTYEAATAAALDALEAAMKRAREAFDRAADIAQDEILNPAREAFFVATRPAKIAYYKAKHEANVTYHIAMAAAEEAYLAGFKTASPPAGKEVIERIGAPISMDELKPILVKEEAKEKERLLFKGLIREELLALKKGECLRYERGRSSELIDIVSRIKGLEFIPHDLYIYVYRE